MVVFGFVLPILGAVAIVYVLWFLAGFVKTQERMVIALERIADGYSQSKPQEAVDA